MCAQHRSELLEDIDLSEALALYVFMYGVMGTATPRTCNPKHAPPDLQGDPISVPRKLSFQRYEVLAIVMGQRQIKLAALWLGAIITGFERHILRAVRTGLLAVELRAAAWTPHRVTLMVLKSVVRMSAAYFIL